MVVDGRLARRIAPAAKDLPGHVPVLDFKLEKVGDTLSGNVVFEVGPEAEVGSLELRYYDYAHGHFVLPLKQGARPVTAGEPLSTPLKNEVLEAGAFNLRRTRQVGGRSAPEGMTFVTVDLRARSLFTTDADATAFDPKARPGTKTKLGYVADWKESRRYLQLVVDGEYGYAPEPQATELEAEPRRPPAVPSFAPRG